MLTVALSVAPLSKPRTSSASAKASSFEFKINLAKEGALRHGAHLLFVT
jgi:hypothetical protein